MIPAKLELANASALQLVRWSNQHKPHEACGVGIVHKDNPGRIVQVIEISNVHPEPDKFFELDGKELANVAAWHRREGGRMIGCYWHSHPDGGAQPSGWDMMGATFDVPMIIVGLRHGLEVKAYWYGTTCEPVRLEVVY